LPRVRLTGEAITDTSSLRIRLLHVSVPISTLVCDFFAAVCLFHAATKRADLSLTILAGVRAVKILRISLDLFLSGWRRCTQQKQVAALG
jgi:hypothetical protein